MSPSPTDEGSDRPQARPPAGLPHGRSVELPGRGTTWVHEHRGPVRGFGTDPDHAALPLLLLHGWTVTGAVNWYPSFARLGRHHRVVSIDHRGHGRGVRTWRRFRLEDCADDVVALADELGIDRFVPVGYSMGGTVAQLVWRRHRDRVAGLVLSATAGAFRERPAEQAAFSLLGGLSVAARLTPGVLRTRVSQRLAVERSDGTATGRWVMGEIARNDPRMVAEAGHAIGRFHSLDWIGEVDVPTAFVVTQHDNVVPTRRQRQLAAAIPGADVYPVAGDHGTCVRQPHAFVPVLAAACRDVSDQALARNRTTKR